MNLCAEMKELQPKADRRSCNLLLLARNKISSGSVGDPEQNSQQCTHTILIPDRGAELDDQLQPGNPWQTLRTRLSNIVTVLAT